MKYGCFYKRGLFLILVGLALLSGCSSAKESQRPRSEPGIQNPHDKQPRVWIAPSSQDARAADGGTLDTIPKALDCNPPEYPPLPREAGIEVVVVIEVLIGIDGEAKNTKVVSSSVSSVMERSALAALRKCRFRPGMRAGVPVECRLNVPVHFTLGP